MLRDMGAGRWWPEGEEEGWKGNWSPVPHHSVWILRQVLRDPVNKIPFKGLGPISALGDILRDPSLEHVPPPRRPLGTMKASSPPRWGCLQVGPLYVACL